MSKALLGSVLTASAAMSSASIAYAQGRDAPPDANHITVGIGILDQHTPFNAEPTQTFPIPLVSIRRGAYYFEAAETGVRLDNKQTELTPAIDIFVAARSPQGHDRANLSVDAGVRISLASGLGKLSGEVRQDVTNTFHGSEIIARYSYPLSLGRFTITLAAEANWLDRRTANFMYGVTSAQRARMIRKDRRIILPVARITDEALNLGGDVSMGVQINKRLTFIAVVGVTHLDRSIRRSAAIDQTWSAQSMTGVTYNF